MKLPLERVIYMGECKIRVFDGMEHSNGNVELSDLTTLRKTYLDQFDHRIMMSLERKCIGSFPGDMVRECETAMLTEFVAEIARMRP